MTSLEFDYHIRDEIIYFNFQIPRFHCTFKKELSVIISSPWPISPIIVWANGSILRPRFLLHPIHLQKKGARCICFLLQIKHGWSLQVYWGWRLIQEALIVAVLGFHRIFIGFPYVYNNCMLKEVKQQSRRYACLDASPSLYGHNVKDNSSFLYFFTTWMFVARDLATTLLNRTRNTY